MEVCPDRIEGRVDGRWRGRRNRWRWSFDHAWRGEESHVGRVGGRVVHPLKLRCGWFLRSRGEWLLLYNSLLQLVLRIFNSGPFSSSLSAWLLPHPISLLLLLRLWLLLLLLELRGLSSSLNRAELMSSLLVWSVSSCSTGCFPGGFHP